MAAGQGTRMRSALAKVLHPVAERPMVAWPVELALALGCDPVVVVLGHQREAVAAALAAEFPEAPVVVAVQAEQLGTAHAVDCARAALAGFAGDVFILSGDVPTLRAETLQAFDAAAGDATVAVAGMRLAAPGAYGRLVRDAQGRLSRIVEARDCAPSELAISEVNSGLYRVDARFLFGTLGTLDRDNAQGEFYLTDIVARAAETGHTVVGHVLAGEAADELLGVNDRVDLAAAETRMQARLRRTAMLAGASFLQPETVRLGHRVRIGADSVIEGGVSLLGRTRIGPNCVVEQGARLIDAEVGEGSTVRAHSVLEGAFLGADCAVGPFARLREGTVLHPGVRIGNFVETKKAELLAGVKAGHLAYLGDCRIGAETNVGAGTITCNYDGAAKHFTEVGAKVFIGSDTQLVAPVRVGDGAFVGAGSTVVADVPAGALALSRSRQVNIEGWVARKAPKKPIKAGAKTPPAQE